VNVKELCLADEKPIDLKPQKEVIICKLLIFSILIVRRVFPLHIIV